MLKLIKYILYFCIGTFILFVVAPIVFVFFFSPEIYKSSLVNMLNKATGRQVSIQGMLHWTVYPELGVSAENVIVNNPTNFAMPESSTEPFLSIRNCQMGVDVVALSHRQINIHHLILEGVKLNLIKNAIGQVNWQIKKSENQSDSNSSVNNISKNSPNELFQFSAPTLVAMNINGSEIHYRDEMKKKTVDLNQISFSAHDVKVGHTFPVFASFIMTIPQISKPVNVNLNAQMLIHSSHENHLIDELGLNEIDARTNQYQWKGSLEDNLSKENLTAISGQLTVTGSNGQFNGIDMYYYSDLADAMIHKTQPTRQNTHQTPFKQLQAMLDIHDGIVTNQNLIIEADRMEASGKGAINLIDQNIDYQLSLQRLTTGNEPKPRGPAIPLMITGDLGSPTIRPDWQSFLVGQLSDQIQKNGEVLGQKIDQAIQQGLQALVSN